MSAGWGWAPEGTPGEGHSAQGFLQRNPQCWLFPGGPPRAPFLSKHQPLPAPSPAVPLSSVSWIFGNWSALEGPAFGKLALGENNNTPQDHVPFFFKFDKYAPSNSWTEDMLLSDQNTVQLAHPLTRELLCCKGHHVNTALAACH